MSKYKVCYVLKDRSEITEVIRIQNEAGYNEFDPTKPDSKKEVAYFYKDANVLYFSKKSTFYNCYSNEPTASSLEELRSILLGDSDVWKLAFEVNDKNVEDVLSFLKMLGYRDNWEIQHPNQIKALCVHEDNTVYYCLSSSYQQYICPKVSSFDEAYKILKKKRQPEIVVGEHNVVFMKDCLKVGCTEIPTKQVEHIIESWNRRHEFI